MGSLQNFRCALNGFNREDVVAYIELVNNKHAAQVNQLKNELQAQQAEAARLRAAADHSQLETQLAQEQARRAQLEEEVEQLRQELAAKSMLVEPAGYELEAYRRAERAERMANARAAQIYDQANGILADATVRVDTSADAINHAAEQVAAQLNQLMQAIDAGKLVMRDTAAAMYGIRPASEQE